MEDPMALDELISPELEFKSLQIVREVPSLLHTCVKYIAVNLCKIQTCQGSKTFLHNCAKLNDDVRGHVFQYLQKRGHLSDEEFFMFLPRDCTNLNLTDCIGISDYALEDIVQTATSIVSVSLVDCFKITDRGLEVLAKSLPNLLKLDLTGCFQITDQGLTHLVKNCTKLNELDLTDCFKVDDTAVSVLIQSQSISILSVAECYRVAWTFQCVPNWSPMENVNRTIKSLCLRHTMVTDDSILLISSMCPELRILDLSWCFELTDQAAMYLSINKLEKLFALNLWGVKRITDNAVTAICRSCANLTSLTLCDLVNITENSIISIIAMLTNLHTLNLWGCTGLSNAGVQLMIRHGTKLQGLSMSFCTQLSDNALSNLDKCTQLKSLQFESCINISDKSLQGLGNENVQTINFRKCTKLSSSAIEECIKRSPNVNVLHISHCRLSNDTILKVLPNCNSLKVLDISGLFDLKDDTLIALLNTDLRTRILSLKMDECSSISDVGIQYVLQLCENLQQLSLCFCPQLTDHAFDKLDARNFGISTISLGGCGMFTDKSIENIARFCPKLKDLVIPWNKSLTDTSMIAVAKQCPNLKTLNVAYCFKITDTGIKEVLTRCRNMRKLDLGFCPDVSVSGMLSTAIYCKNLQSLRMKRHVSDTIASFFEEQMKKHCPNLKLETAG